MAYQVIARKWRPNSFAELVGQSHVSQTLLNALKSDRLPHALLFTGPRGTGKTSSARILAKALRCTNAKDFTPCNTCQDCEDIAAGRSVNVIEIDGASNNGVDAIRELRDTVGYMPSAGKYKVYIIDEVHMLSTSAFNALLKTLEEPPEHVIFILATTEVHKIPNTILSRCQRFDFRRIAFRSTAEHLRGICEADNVKAEDQALWLIARQGEGSMRDSQSLLDQVITFSSGDITLQKVVDVLGLTDRQLLADTLQALVEHDSTKVMDVVRRIFNSGFDPKLFAQDLLEEIRNMLIVKLCPNEVAGIVDLPDTEISNLGKMAESLSQEDIHMLFDMALKGGNDIPRASDPRIVLEMMLLRMAAAPRIESLLNWKSAPATTSAATTAQKNFRPQAPKQPVPSRPTPTQSASTQPTTTQQPSTQPAAAPKQQPTAEPAPSGSPQEKWSQLVNRIKRVNGVVGAKLEHSYLIEVTVDKKVRVGIPGKMKFLFDQISDEKFLNKLSNYMKTFWGPGFRVEVALGDTSSEKKSLTPKGIEAQQKALAAEQVRREVENHPLVKSTKNIFKSEIQSIKETKS